MVTVPRQSLHCHTVFSDGVATPAEMVAAAAAAGFTRLGISDHLVLHPELADIDWAMAPGRLGEYVAAVRAAGRGAGLEVRVGLEVDWFPDPGFAARLAALLAPHAIDYLIGSVHYLDRFNHDGRIEDWQALSTAEVDAAHARYWERIAGLAACGGWAFVGHLDLPKKFGRLPTQPPATLIDDALAALVGAGLPIELNTSGWNRLCAESYPGPALLRRCRALGIPVLVNDDAHAPSQLGQHYERAARVLTEAGYDAVADPIPHGSP